MTKRSPMNTFKQPVEGARYLRTFLDVHVARLRTALGDKDRGASAVELAVITAVLVGLAVAILVIVVNFANKQGTTITNTTVPNPAQGQSAEAIVTRDRVRGPGRGPGRILARARLARGGRERGASAVELAILAPALIFASLLIVQFAIWFDARPAALAAAQQGDLVAREDASVTPGAWQGLAESAATSYYRGLNTSLISGVTAQAAPG